MYADFGYTCGQSLTRKHNLNGVSEPNLKNGTKDLSYLFGIGTSVIDNMNPLFLDGELAWTEKNLKRSKEYSNKIFQEIVLRH